MEPSRPKEWWVPQDGIEHRVIQTDISRYLGDDATVRRGVVEMQDVYVYRAYRPLTSAMIKTMQEHSAQWLEERQTRRFRGVPEGDYHTSATLARAEQNEKRSGPRENYFELASDSTRVEDPNRFGRPPMEEDRQVLHHIPRDQGEFLGDDDNIAWDPAAGADSKRHRPVQSRGHGGDRRGWQDNQALRDHVEQYVDSSRRPHYEQRGPRRTTEERGDRDRFPVEDRRRDWQPNEEHPEQPPPQDFRRMVGEVEYPPPPLPAYGRGNFSQNPYPVPPDGPPFPGTYGAPYTNVRPEFGAGGPAWDPRGQNPRYTHLPPSDLPNRPPPEGPYYRGQSDSEILHAPPRQDGFPTVPGPPPPGDPYSYNYPGRR